MTDKEREFPCIFGVEAVTLGTLRYGFVRDAHGQQSVQLAGILRQFTDVCRGLGKRTSLVCFFESWRADRVHAAYWQRFWDLLREVAAIDSVPWPEQISRDLDDPHFEFTFNGHPMFVVVNTDLHKRRQSRRLSRVTITFQPRFVFDDIAEGTPRGDAARAVIRARLADYDASPVSETFGSFGDANNREWAQYYIGDGDPADVSGSCPFSRL